MSQPIKRVVKVGGSLFDWPDFPLQLWHWLHAQPPAENYLIAGGGRLADAIRHYDPVLGLGEATSHQLCLDLLGVTARLLEACLERAAKQLGAWPPTTTVLDVNAHLPRSSTALPECWEVTTDSLAAMIARQLCADELVLLKSAAPLPPYTVAHAAAAGYVDAFFPAAAAGLPRLRAVNLRDATCCWLQA